MNKKLKETIDSGSNVIVINEAKEDILYTVKEVATLIKTNTGYVYRLLDAGLLPCLKLGNRKIRKTALLEFLEKYEGMDLTNPENIVANNMKVIQ